MYPNFLLICARCPYNFGRMGPILEANLFSAKGEYLAHAACVTRELHIGKYALASAHRNAIATARAPIEELTKASVILFGLQHQVKNQPTPLCGQPGHVM